jgi:predicted molibdopterin-dependent oxidoreductase YjgC
MLKVFIITGKESKVCSGSGNQQQTRNASYADVILPAAAWSERGAMTNAERRISFLNKVMDASGGWLPDFEMICLFARKMGCKDLISQTPLKSLMNISGLQKAKA